MSPVLAGSLGVGICCFFYPLIANALDLSVWMSFAGCTSYFVAGGGKTGIIKSLGSNYTGMAWALLVFWFGGTSLMQIGGNTALMLGALATGFISWAMTYQSRINLLSFVPSTFIGCFSTFGSGGDWKMMSACILAGNLLGLSCDYTGKFLFKTFGKEAPAQEADEADYVSELES